MPGLGAGGQEPVQGTARGGSQPPGLLVSLISLTKHKFRDKVKNLRQ